MCFEKRRSKVDRLKHSVTLYGFGSEYMRGEESLKDILKKVKKIGADGFEIVSPQMVEGHPNPSEEWIKRFIDMYQTLEMTPVCYSIYVDNGKHYGRFMTEDERFLWTVNEMEYAKRMGFSIVRSQEGLLAGTMEKLLPYAEALDLHLSVELHGPHTPESPVFKEFEELYDRVKSPHLGFVMDFSSFLSGAPATVLNVLPDDSCHKELLHKIRRLYTTTEIPVEELNEMILKEGGDEVDLYIAKEKLYTGRMGKMGSDYFRTHPDYEGFRRYLKYSRYMHGKFFHVDENLVSEGIDYPGFIRIMKEENYQGFVASEYEGAGLRPGLSQVEEIERHIKMLDKLWNEN